LRWLIAAATRVLSGHPEYAAVPGTPDPNMPGLGRWFALLTPVAARRTGR